jgi:gliding motility-associated-like protein
MTQANSKDSIVFINIGSKNNQPNWNFGDGNTANSDSTIHAFKKAGTYTVSLSTTSINGCLETTSIIITIEPNDYFIPNAFSPNGDFNNDDFAPVGDDIVDFSLKIYNRWGIQVFNGDNIAWNGRSSNGTIYKNGVYTYLVQITLSNGVSEEFKGNVNLFR